MAQTNAERFLNVLPPGKRELMRTTFSDPQIEILIKYYDSLRKFPFYREFGIMYTDRKRFMDDLQAFSSQIGITPDKIRFMSIEKGNLQNLKKTLKNYSINSEVFRPWKNNTGSLYHCLIIKNYKEVLNGKN